MNENKQIEGNTACEEELEPQLPMKATTKLVFFGAIMGVIIASPWIALSFDAGYHTPFFFLVLAAGALILTLIVLATLASYAAETEAMQPTLERVYGTRMLTYRSALIATGITTLFCGVLLGGTDWSYDLMEGAGWIAASIFAGLAGEWTAQFIASAGLSSSEE